MTIGLMILIQMSVSSPEVTSERATCSTAPEILLTWIDPGGLLPDVTGLSKEVEILFADAGVDVDWQVYRGRRAPSRDRVEVHVHLRSNEPARWKLGAHAMGVTYHERRRAERVYVFFPAIARTLGWRPEALRAHLKRRPVITFERALSRVIAHEVIHAIQPRLEHGQSGITRSRLTRTMLRTVETNIDEQARRRFYEALAAFRADEGLAPRCGVVPSMASQ